MSDVKDFEEFRRRLRRATPEEGSNNSSSRETWLVLGEVLLAVLQELRTVNAQLKDIFEVMTER